MHAGKGFVNCLEKKSLKYWPGVTNRKNRNMHEPLWDFSVLTDCIVSDRGNNMQCKISVHNKKVKLYFQVFQYDIMLYRGCREVFSWKLGLIIDWKYLSLSSNYFYIRTSPVKRLKTDKRWITSAGFIAPSFALPSLRLDCLTLQVLKILSIYGLWLWLMNILHLTKYAIFPIFFYDSTLWLLRAFYTYEKCFPRKISSWIQTILSFSQIPLQIVKNIFWPTFCISPIRWKNFMLYDFVKEKNIPFLQLRSNKIRCGRQCVSICADSWMA